jgi:hypothetical protein
LVQRATGNAAKAVSAAPASSNMVATLENSRFKRLRHFAQMLGDVFGVGLGEDRANGRDSFVRIDYA